MHEPYRNDYYQSWEEILAAPKIKPATSVRKSAMLPNELWGPAKAYLEKKV